jgi:hypothetical protein
MKRSVLLLQRSRAPSLAAGTCALLVTACVSPGGESGYGGYGGSASTGGYVGSSGYAGGYVGGYAATGSSSASSSSGSSASAGGAGGSQPSAWGSVPEFEGCQCDWYDIYYLCDECPASVTCERMGDTCNEGQCRPSCTKDADCPSGGTCRSGLCILPCTPGPAPDGCPSGTACSTLDDGVACLPRADVSATAPCIADESCPAGTTCRGDTTHDDGACDAWCRVGQAGDCADGTLCVGFDTPLVVGGVTYGACRAVCDPTTTCAGGGRCEIETSGGVPFTDCMPPGKTSGITLCSVTTDCPPGDVCRVHGPDQASCEPLCALPGGACPSGAVCTPLVNGPTVNGVTYGTCTAACDLLSASCGASDACAVVTDTPGGAPATDCVPAGSGIGAFGCEGQLCVPGAVCASFVPSLALTACETYCRVGQDDCPPQFTCAALVPAVTIGGTAYGQCQDDCNLATPEDICGPDAACLPIVDGVNAPHTACAGIPPSCQTFYDANCQPQQVCTPASAFPLGAACTDAGACPPGATCENGRCVDWCVIGPTGHCPGGTLCKPGAPPLVIAGISYGTCQ